MYGQSLDDDESLNVRWAAEDTSPAALAEEKRRNETIVFGAIEKKLPKVGEKGTILDYMNHYDDAETKKRKLDQEGGATDVARTAIPDIHNPNAYVSGTFDYNEYYNQYEKYAKYYGQDSNPYTAEEEPEFYDNSAYAYTDNADTNLNTNGYVASSTGATVETDSVPDSFSTRDLNGFESESKSEIKKSEIASPSALSKGSTAGTALSRLAAYGSDDEE
jgi:hypothetical protein